MPIEGNLTEAVQLDLSTGQLVEGVFARGCTSEGQRVEIFVPDCELPGRLGERPEEVAQAMRERIEEQGKL